MKFIEVFKRVIRGLARVTYTLIGLRAFVSVTRFIQFVLVGFAVLTTGAVVAGQVKLEKPPAQTQMRQPILIKSKNIPPWMRSALPQPRGLISTIVTPPVLLSQLMLPVPPPPRCMYAFPVTGLIWREWMRIGGPDSPIGCPVGKFLIDGPKGSGFQPFAHGQIAVSPGVWGNGVVAAFQDGNAIKVDWTVSWGAPNHPSHYNYNNYDEFLVRWDFNGKHTDTGNVCGHDRSLPGDGDQCQVIADMTHGQPVLLHYYLDTHLRAKGTWSVPVDHGDGNYSILVEGCDEPSLQKARCRQGWMHPVVVSYQTITNGSADYPIDLRGIPSASTVAQSGAAFFQRAAAVVLYEACRMLPYSVYRNEDDYGVIVLAKLAYADYYQSDYCPGRNQIDNRAEASASLTQQSVESKTGTTVDSCPGCRTGEYDFALSNFVMMFFGYRSTLSPAARVRLANVLLNKNGSLDDGDMYIESGVVPESENHLNLIESSRFLINQYLYGVSKKSEYDNVTNGLSYWWLARLQRYLQTDFIEYNARPYQEYSIRALENLASYSSDTNVREATLSVLDYVSAKLAVSSNDLRRVVPYRRRLDSNDAPFGSDLLTWHADPQSGRLMMLGGNLDILLEGPLHAQWGAAYGAGMAETAALGRYAVPDLILDLMVNPKHRIFYQAIHHYADELYASEPSFLLSAGGHYATYAYRAEVFASHDDIGLALPTTLMPTGRFVSRDDLIRFEGDSDDTKRSNMCVAPDFACGLNPVIPPSMVPAAPGCVDSSHPNWTFIDFSPACTGKGPFGMYIAVYQQGKLGFLEAFDTYVNPNISFNEFVSGVWARNGAQAYTLSGNNTYVTTLGEEIEFTVSPDSRIVAISNGPAVPSGTDFASGTIIQSQGQSAIVTITNPFLGQQLRLDDHDLQHPKLVFVSKPPYPVDACRTGFVWREAFQGDHVCVTVATRTLTGEQNAAGPSRRSPNGGAYGPDTCLQGYVWRQANPGDHVCVTPQARADTAFDNRLAPSRLAAVP